MNGYTWPPGKPRKKRLRMRPQDFPKMRKPDGSGNAPVYCARPDCTALATLSCTGCLASEGGRRIDRNGPCIIVRHFLTKSWCRRHAPCWKGSRPYCSDDCAAAAETGRRCTAA